MWNFQVIPVFLIKALDISNLRRQMFKYSHLEIGYCVWHFMYMQFMKKKKKVPDLHSESDWMVWMKIWLIGHAYNVRPIWNRKNCASQVKTFYSWGR